MSDLETYKIESTSDALTYLYGLSLDDSSFRFRGQSDFSWTLQPTIYRFSNFKRYQTVDYESTILQSKPRNKQPPLTHTNYDLEWLMLCQHYGVPTRLLDWTADILIALYFASSGNADVDGAVFVCDQNNYKKFSAYNQHSMDCQDLTFINTNIVNPRMRMQLGCFMMWGHAPLNDNDTESYDLWEYSEQQSSQQFLKKIIIPQSSKKQILSELEGVYSITQKNVFIKNGYMDNNYGNSFAVLKENSRLMCLYKTDADQLTTEEEKKARAMFRVDCRNMIGGCSNLRKIK